ncbi:acyl-CoA/acyl-ACP dehydrogenase [Streptomyces rhizosphaerihabitans]|uniref:acyl-CoA/acyl-ACP dehydrogenase n=1 Tax=Streptomyces rhizosphaerihabitans TaxID=1266770 RepID=UPI0021C116FF|nr:acyl-CoA/acyl-ACP dehydrogenase [Streptomyces rhizosphaerihabitans]MCT9008467.1 acyl-CoA/acyl-ACP dehydrogenase [Streptomyces rhizosphaerihabitans]
MSYRSSLSAVLAEVVAPAAEVTVREGRFPRAAVTALGRSGLLGLTVSPEFGGGGLGPAEAADVVARTARVCPATAVVLTSHFAAVAAIESRGGSWVRGEIAAGRHLAGLALNEGGPGEQGAEVPHGMSCSVATRFADVVALRGRKRRVVASGEADSYLWSSRPLAGPDGLTLWVVPAQAPDLFVPARPGGGGPSGSATSTLCADPVLVPADVMLGRDGGGFDILLRTVRPWLLELGAAIGDDVGPGADVLGPGADVSGSGADVLGLRGEDLALGSGRRPADSLAAT